MQETVIADLRVRLLGGDDGQGGGNGPLVVLLHGFGAPGDDLVSLAQVLRGPEGTRFAFPEAPMAISIPFAPASARAWWRIEQAMLERALMTGTPRDLQDEHPEGLESARLSVCKLLDALNAPERLFLGGFSQGAVLACDVALHTERRLSGLILWSGALISQSTWVPRMAARAGLAVVQSHGRQDPLLSFSAAELLRDRLRGAGLGVDWVPFTGGHEIPPDAVAAANNLLNAR